MMRLLLRYGVYGAIMQFCNFSVVASFSFPTLPKSTTFRTTTSRIAAAPSCEQSMDTALCIIPPGPFWDTIQRSRHAARDDTYHKWPPAIRLFHPFFPRKALSDVALEIAQVIEKHEIEPFEISLNEWVIIPHMEALEAEWEALAKIGEPVENTNEKDLREQKEQEEVDRLIAREERRGRQQQRIRQLKRPKKESKKINDVNGSTPRKTKTTYRKQSEEDSPRALLEKQKQMYQEFNGPCVICLEPDPESRAKLKELRELLQTKFGQFHAYSPTSSVSSALPSATSEYRPILPIGRFPTVTSAIEMARKLKGLWEPLTFQATDLQLISVVDKANNNGGGGHNNFLSLEPSSHDNDEEHLIQFGCDAMVMLMGEEMEMDQEENQKMAQELMEKGIPGGGSPEQQELNGFHRYQQEAAMLDSQSSDDEGDTSELEEWLDEEEYDEGTVVVIGRTHFFTGEMRLYVGMPASSSLDGQDRVAGDNLGAKERRTGAARPYDKT